MVTLASGNVMIMGGITNSRQVGLFNPTTGSYNKVKEGNWGRYLSACTVFNSAKHGHREVVYIGGGTSTEKAEILDFTLTETWEQIDDLPEITSSGSRALPTPTGDGVLHIIDSKMYELTC